VIWNVLALLLLVILAGIAYLIYREYRRSRSRRVPAYTAALMDLLDGRKDEAYEKLKETVSIDSENVDAYLRLADLLMERGDVPRATRLFQMLAVRRNLATSDEKKVLLALAREHMRQQRTNKAISVLEQVTELDPRDTTSQEMLLMVYVEQKRWDDVKTVLKDLLKAQKDKHRAALYCTEIGARIHATEPETAAGYFEQALQLDPGAVPALLYAGDVEYGKGNLNQAVAKWQQALKAYPELSFMVRERLEKAYYEAGRYEELVKVYDELIAQLPQDTGLSVALARIHAKKGDVERARTILARLPATAQDETAVRLLQADLRLNQGNIEETRNQLARLEDQLTRRSFRCSRCGLVSEGEFSWHCPQCGAWESFAASRKTAK
jgi:lipopolysaccharide biosynthesis regulator YciM